MWDTNLVERAVDNTPAKWAKPLSSDVEQHLHGDKYDSLIRKTLVGGINKTWAQEFPSWVQCPSTSGLDDQTVLQPSWNPSETDDETICPWAWANPIHKITCDWAWPKELDSPPYDEPNGPLLELDTDDYSGKIADEWVIEKLLAMGGLRLASILNQIFSQSG
jgi:hypothetical protein